MFLLRSAKLTYIAMGNPPFEDVSPIKTGGFSLLCRFTTGYKKWGKLQPAMFVLPEGFAATNSWISKAQELMLNEAKQAPATKPWGCPSWATEEAVYEMDEPGKPSESTFFFKAIMGLLIFRGFKLMEMTCNSINSNLFSLEAHASGVISV